MPNEGQREYFRNLDARICGLYLNLIMYKDLSRKREELYDLAIKYNELVRLMESNNTYYAICTRIKDVEAFLIEAGLLQPEKKAGCR